MTIGHRNPLLLELFADVSSMSVRGRRFDPPHYPAVVQLAGSRPAFACLSTGHTSAMRLPRWVVRLSPDRVIPWDTFFARVAQWRQARALHPRGEVFAAELTLPQGWPGVVQPGRDPVARQVIVRMSKGGGLPGGWPDVLGLAVRVDDPSGPVDLLLSTTGRGRLTRWLPVPRRDWSRGTIYGSIMPFRSGTSVFSVAAIPDQRPVPSSLQALVHAVQAEPFGLTLVTAAPMRDWQPLGRLVLTEHRPGVRVSFDPIVNAHPHLTPIPRTLSVVRKLAYAGSRRGQGA
jgi:hypothetical protein